MMKRSDSVNKRWSANLTGISRQNSIASNRSSYAVRMPLSSGEESSLGGQNVTDDKDLRAKNAPSLHVRSKSSIVQLGDRRPEFSSPPSPKKWSPTKSSWLESKITKSDEKPPAPPPAQPSWMADLAKAKQNRNDVSVGGPSPEFKSPQTPVRPELAPKPAPLLAQEPGVAVRKSPPPIAPKAQPSAPGKVDFRANLKPRSLQSDGGRAAEPEFKSALGKLRHTQAEKYVAPNDFKDNILRGKSALNVTGGPAKRERVDDFKQSILQQKEAMKAKSAAPKSPPEKPKEPVSTPEGLAKRNALNKRGPPVPAAKSDLVPEALARQADVRKPTLENARPSAEVRKSPAAEPPTIGAERKTAPVGTEQVVRKTDAVAPLALSTERKPTPKPLSSTTEQLAPKADVDSPTPSAALTVGKEPSAGPKYGSAKLAGRLNPGLANLLAKGPPASVSLRREEPAKADDGEGPQLRHMTKNRARGPKRRAPKAAQAAETQPSDGPRTGSEIPAPSVARPLPSAAEDMPKGKSKPPVAEKSAVLSSMVGEPEKTAQATDPTGDASREKTTQQHPFRSAVAAPSSPPRPSKPLSISAKSSRSNAASPTPSPGRPKSPIKLPAREDEVKMNFAPPKLDVDSGKPSFAIKTPGLATVESKAAPSPMPKAAPVAEPERPKKPARMTAIAIKVPPPEPSSPEPRSLFADYFDDHPRITPGCEIDVLGVLQSHPKNEKVETIRTSIHEMSGDGKLSPLPSNQEHVLFEDAMYVCVHLCKTARGTRSTEVYLWVGSSVPQAASEDGHVFARKVAKDHGGKLQLVPQGKEPSGMFAALGGILITLRQRDAETRGLPSRFMLCGRHHLGHMAFDSLDFGPGSLCSGFPYLVRGGSSLFLWAGAGCTVEELDCARLVAMDLLAASADPGAAFLEIKDGDEPPAFLDLFDRGVGRTRPPRIPPSASHWRLKPAVGSRYCSRLFRISQRSTSPRKAGALQVGHQLLGWASHLLPSPTAGSMDPAVASGSKPTSPVKEAGADLQAAACDVEELVPFDCADLQRDGGVWVLDAFFEMYMWVSLQKRWPRLIEQNATSEPARARAGVCGRASFRAGVRNPGRERGRPAVRAGHDRRPRRRASRLARRVPPLDGSRWRACRKGRGIVTKGQLASRRPGHRVGGGSAVDLGAKLFYSSIEYTM
jgi:hypothetical protein